MRRISRMERRKILNGWMGWALLPLIPFLVLFVDAWLNVQIRQKDYELMQLDLQKRSLDGELQRQMSLLTQRKHKEYIEGKAKELGLQSPGIQQFQMVQYRDVPRRAPVMRMEDMAPLFVPLDISEDRVEVAVRPTAVSGPGGASAPSASVSGSSEGSPADGQASPAAGHAVPIAEDSELSFMTVEDMLSPL